jgi:hypothetical protein
MTSSEERKQQQHQQHQHEADPVEFLRDGQHTQTAAPVMLPTKKAKSARFPLKVSDFYAVAPADRISNSFIPSGAVAAAAAATRAAALVERVNAKKKKAVNIKVYPSRTSADFHSTQPERYNLGVSDVNSEDTCQSPRGEKEKIIMRKKKPY